MREGLERLYRGYLLALISAILMIIPYLSLLALALAGAAAYFIYSGFKYLSKVDKKYAPGKKGILFVFVGTVIAFLSIFFQPLALAALAVLVYGMVEYFKGLWALGDLKGGEPIKLGVIVASAAFALSIITSVFVADLYLRGRPEAPFLKGSVFALLLADQFLAGASIVLMLAGVKGILNHLPKARS